MIACACGGILEVGLIGLIVSGLSALVARIINAFRRRRHNRALAAQIIYYAQQSNEELMA